MQLERFVAKSTTNSWRTWRNSLLSANTPTIARKKPNLVLLKADLLFNGGYGQKALDLLSKHKTESFDGQKDKINYVYLKGRISQDMRSEKAISYFKETIEIGRNKPYYFACNAALQIGLIYENRSMTSTAKRYYKICLSIKPSEYRSSLHAKAKAGLNRLKK